MTVTRGRFAWIVLFPLAAILLLGLRTQWQDHEIRSLLHDQRVATYQSCLQRRANVEATIALRAQLADVEGPRVAAVYARFPLLVPDCGRPPK